MYNMQNFNKILLFSILALVLVVSPMKAFGADWLESDAPSNATILDAPVAMISNGMIAAFFHIAGTVSFESLNIGASVLNYAVGDSVLGGNGFTLTDNATINSGWTVTRNLANAILVIGLVIIAITIILGFQENKAKQYLINFIIIALLINFTPAICGFIIDGANIITKSMLTGGVDASYAISIKNIFDWLGDSTNGINNPAMVLAIGIIVFVFSLLSAVIYFLYAILFIARIVILWILVIVSPIAFATYVFPQSKYIRNLFPSITYWDDWWQSFVQWCVIGIPAGMSIYLANGILVKLGSAQATIASQQNVFDILFKYLIPFIFLLVGFFITISTGEKAASKLSGELTGFAKRGMGAVGSAGLGVAGGLAGAAASALNDEEKKDANGRVLSTSEKMQLGYASGKETAQKEGLAGSTMIAAGKLAGGTIGVGGGIVKGTKNWALRSTGIDNELKQRDNTQRQVELAELSTNTKLTNKEKAAKGETINKKYDDKIASYGQGYVESIKSEGGRGLREGAIKTAANTAGSTIAGALGGGVGAALGAVNGAFEGDIKRGIVEGTVRGGTLAAEEGGKIGKAVGKVASNVSDVVVKGSAKTIYGELTGKFKKEKGGGDKTSRKKLFDEFRDRIKDGEKPEDID